MKCCRKGINDRIKARLKMHSERMQELIQSGMDKAAASKQAFDEITHEKSKKSIDLSDKK